MDLYERLMSLRPHDRRTLLLSLCLIPILIALCFYFWGMHRVEEAEVRKEADEYAEQVRPLRLEQARLKREIRDTEDAIRVVGKNLGSVMILCTEADARLEENIYSLLLNYNYVGVIALSDASFPGQEGCISLTDLNHILGKGWEICLSVDQTTNLSSLYQRTVSAGLPAPRAIYCPDGVCTPAQQEVAKKLGITVLISHEKDAASQAPDFWCVAASGSNEATSQTRLSRAAKESEAIALTVGYQRSRDMYEIENYSEMLRVVAIEYTTTGTLRVTGVNEAIERHEERELALATSAQELYRQKEELEAQLAVVEQQINDLTSPAADGEGKAG